MAILALFVGGELEAPSFTLGEPLFTLIQNGFRTFCEQLLASPPTLNGGARLTASFTAANVWSEFYRS